MARTMIPPAASGPHGKRGLARAAYRVRMGLWSLLQNREYLAARLGVRRLLYQTTFRGGKITAQDPGLNHRECQPLVDPPFLPASRADHMRDDDVVLGLEIDGDARAYPWWIMDNHHVANDVVGGRAVLLVLCEMCSTGMAFDRVVEGRPLRFRHEHVYNGTVAVSDDQTGSLWSTYFAMAIRGRLKGRRLDLLPLVHMEWGAWRALHPETVVLPGELGSRVGHGSDHVIGLPGVPESMRATMARWDERLPHNTLVLGIVTDHGERAYPLEEVRSRGGVVHDTVGPEAVVVLAHPEDRYAVLAFRPEVDGRRLSFQPDPVGARDRETGSRWTLHGEAVEGPLAGSRLPFVPSHVGEWFIWATHFPEIEIWE